MYDEIATSLDATGIPNAAPISQLGANPSA
jgi:hypothetical protein